jgi:hypothetical protein
VQQSLKNVFDCIIEEILCLSECNLDAMRGSDTLCTARTGNLFRLIEHTNKFDQILKDRINHTYKKTNTGNVRLNVTTRRVRLTISNKYYVISECDLSYPTRKSHAPYYAAICGLSGSTIFFYIILLNARFSEKSF